VTDGQPPTHHESPIRRFLFESALIVFSILLALAVNQWADSRKQRQLTDRALTAIHAEILANSDRIRERRPYHLSLESELKLADSIRNVHRYSDLKHAAPDWSGFENPELDETAWQSAMTLGVAPNLGFDTLQTLSRLYGLQVRFDQYNSAAIPTFDFSDEAMHSTIRRMYVYVATMRTNEDTLLNRYTAALKLLGPPPPAATR
jgi:type II secretory pathway pseudopilin PulG